MDANQMIQMVRRLYDEVYSKGNISLCDELCANNVKLNDPAVESFKPGLSAFKESEKQYHKAFPSKKAKIDDIFAAGDKVIVRWTFQGKQDGDLQGIAPTHRTCSLKGISIYQFSNGKISEIWQYWDRLGLLEQLGVVQPEHALH